MFQNAFPLTAPLLLFPLMSCATPPWPSSSGYHATRLETNAELFPFNATALAIPLPLFDCWFRNAIASPLLSVNFAVCWPLRKLPEVEGKMNPVSAPALGWPAWLVTFAKSCTTDGYGRGPVVTTL